MSATLGGFLAVAAFSALGSGEGGGIMLLGTLLAVGSAGLLLFSAIVFLRRPPPAAQIEPVHHNPLQRIALLIIGSMALAWSGNAIVTGRFDASGSRRDVVRDVNPSHYWQAVSLYLLAGGACLYLGLRRAPGSRETDTSAPKNSRRGRKR